MKLELTPAQARDLSAIDAKGFVLAVRRDILRNYPAIAASSLSERLAVALRQACAMGITEDANLVDFLGVEALTPGFHQQPGLRGWMVRPGGSPDRRFRDFMQVMRWRLRHGADPRNTE